MRSIIVAATLLCLPCSPAAAFRVPIQHPSCPENDPRVSWIDFMSGKFPDVPGKRAMMAGVEFRTAKAVNDPKSIGGLNTAICYVTTYNKGRPGWADGYASYSNAPGQSGPDMKQGLPGDPKKGEINVYGVLLLFNSAGEIKNTRGKTVGVLKCYTTDQCMNY